MLNKTAEECKHPLVGMGHQWAFSFALSSKPNLERTDKFLVLARTTVIALYPYNAQTDGDLSFSKLDHMIVLDDLNPDWWYVEHIKTGKQGFVPRNFVYKQMPLENEEWYAGQIARKMAECLVQQSGLPDGTFLIRERETVAGDFVLTLQHTKSDGCAAVKHYKIKRLDAGCLCITSQKTFKTLQELVQYYMGSAMGLPCQLTLPAPRVFSKRLDQPNWEIPRSALQPMHKLGTGKFGTVFYGRWHGLDVAIKTIKCKAMSTQAFLTEAAIMMQCSHPNLVKLYGVCSRKEPLYIVMEHMINGSLEQFLRGQLGQRAQLSTLVNISAQVANGMSYLEKQKMVHRDLSARNILVGDIVCDVPFVKIADFGLARMLVNGDVYKAKPGEFPLKWLPPEDVTCNCFTVKSDVWSYGVLLHEILSKGQTPYPGMNNELVILLTKCGYRMPCPKDTPPPIYEIMLSCWNAVAEKRPTFCYLHHFFDNYPTTVQSSCISLNNN